MKEDSLHVKSHDFKVVVVSKSKDKANTGEFYDWGICLIIIFGTLAKSIALRPGGREVRSKAFLDSKLSNSLCMAASQTLLSGQLMASWYEFGGLVRSQDLLRRKGRGADKKQSCKRLV